jgi:DNA-binding transcriptional ArsR family regulator
MVRYEFTVEDLAKTRFAISPMWETTAAIHALRHPGVFSLHLQWVKHVRSEIRGLDLSLALALMPRHHGYAADFLTPPPLTPLSDFETELELVRSTAPEQIRSDVETLIARGNPRDTLRPYLDDPTGAVGELAELLRAFWRRAVEPHWGRIKSLLEADLLYRSRRLTQGGVSLLFADLHPLVAWSDGGVEVTMEYADRVELGGRGLVLVPSAFSCDKPSTMTEPPWQPTVVYAARGVGLLWESASAPPEALTKVLGRSRARLLSDLDAPRTTTDLAERLQMTPGGVSQHLSALRDSALVSARRSGRQVLYFRSPLADELVGARGPAPARRRPAVHGQGTR